MRLMVVLNAYHRLFPVGVSYLKALVLQVILKSTLSKIDVDSTKSFHYRNVNQGWCCSGKLFIAV